MLDIVHRADGPSILVLGNTIKSGSHGRGSGVIEDRADIAYEVRDATGFQPSGTKDWWTELPAAGREAWAERATRRTRRDRYVLAFVPSKFRVGEEPEPFALEITLAVVPWSLREVTAELNAAGEAARAQTEAERAATEAELVASLVAEVDRRAAADELPLARTEAVDLLHGDGTVSRAVARTVLDRENGARWRLVKDVARRGHPVFVVGMNQAWPRQETSNAKTPAASGLCEEESLAGVAAQGPQETPPGKSWERRSPETPVSCRFSRTSSGAGDGKDGNGAGPLRLACATCGSTECSGCDPEPAGDDAPIFETGLGQVCVRCGGRRWRHRGVEGDECVTCHPISGPKGT